MTVQVEKGMLWAEILDLMLQRTSQEVGQESAFDCRFLLLWVQALSLRFTQRSTTIFITG